MTRLLAVLLQRVRDTYLLAVAVCQGEPTPIRVARARSR
jgi:hypothetical protein